MCLYKGIELTFVFFFFLLFLLFWFCSVSCANFTHRNVLICYVQKPPLAQDNTSLSFMTLGRIWNPTEHPLLGYRYEKRKEGISPEITLGVLLLVFLPPNCDDIFFSNMVCCQVIVYLFV